MKVKNKKRSQILKAFSIQVTFKREKIAFYIKIKSLLKGLILSNIKNKMEFLLLTIKCQHRLQLMKWEESTLSKSNNRQV